jgi:DNA invertase Pin-like site-specific DNA recombinase
MSGGMPNETDLIGECRATTPQLGPLSDLIGLLGELRSRDIDLYLHQQALHTSTPLGQMVFGMLGVFSEFERAISTIR